MSEDSGATVGVITGYLRLDKSDWSAEMTSAKGQADALGRTNPNIKIETNAPSAIAQLELVAAAAKRLQDAQGKVSVAQAKVNQLETSGKASAAQLSAAHENLAKAMRDVELQQIRVSSAFERATDDANRLGGGPGSGLAGVAAGAEDAGGGIMQFLLPALGLAATALGPLAAVGAGAFGTVLLGSTKLENQVKTGLTPAFKQLQGVAAAALEPGVNAAIAQLQQALPKLDPLIVTFGTDIGNDVDQLAGWLNSTGIQDFVSYAQAELPTVENAFKGLAAATLGFFEDVTPIGNDVLNTVTAIGDAVSRAEQFLAKFEAPGSTTGSGTLPDGSPSSGLGSYKQVNPKESIVHQGEGILRNLATSFTNPGNPVTATYGTSTAEKQAKAAAQFASQFASNQSTAAGRAGPLNYGNIDPVSAAALGGSLHDIVNGLDAVASQTTAANQIAYLGTQFANDNPAVQGLITQLGAFSTSQDTAVDKAKLLGAILVESQGDALGYGSALSQGYAATQDFISGFTASEKAAVSAKTGLIDYKDQGAAPLVQQLQAMQTAAQNAAEATYQHEVATKGDSTALQDAQNIFESMTGGSLVANAKQLGITAAEAKKLANNYFAVPPNVSTLVQSVGLNNINTTLLQIGQNLAQLTGQTWVVNFGTAYPDDAAGLKGHSLHGATNDIPLPSVFPSKHATGIQSLNEGLSWVGDGGMPELLSKSGPNVTVYSGTRSKTKAGSSSAPQVVYRDITFMMDGKVVTKIVNEQNLRGQRR